MSLINTQIYTHIHTYRHTYTHRHTYTCHSPAARADTDASASAEPGRGDAGATYTGVGIPLCALVGILLGTVFEGVLLSFTALVLMF